MVYFSIKLIVWISIFYEMYSRWKFLTFFLFSLLPAEYILLYRFFSIMMFHLPMVGFLTVQLEISFKMSMPGYITDIFLIFFFFSICHPYSHSGCTSLQAHKQRWVFSFTCMFSALLLSVPLNVFISSQIEWNLNLF